ncbi:MAG: hypothetical protein JSW27_05725 [Phycisphaerales bacterium]|nr:MAG: hypothetical protein JSW27_05725 [Phycisphaerales bacterium]
MARIIYAVAGEGYGHSTRAHLVGQRLLDAGHDVMFVASQKALQYLRSIYGPRVKEIFGLSFAYRRGRIDPAVTFTRNLFQVARAHSLNRRLFQQHYRSFNPDLVITDFEPFTGWWAFREKVPFISLDNEHLLTVCRLEHRLRHFLPRLAATAVTKSFGIGAASYVVTNFFSVPVRSDKALLAPPIVRPLVTQLKPSDAGHVVVYWTTGTEEARLRSVLRRFRDQTFHVYGFDKSAQVRNCVFKQPSTEGFLADLAAARGVVASAGLSLISECMYWRKKMLLLPLPGQYEQLINAHYFDKLGLGIAARRLNEATLGRFLQEVDEPVSGDERILWPDNERFFDTLAEALRRLRTPISIAVREVGSDIRTPPLAEVGS